MTVFERPEEFRARLKQEQLVRAQQPEVSPEKEDTNQKRVARASLALFGELDALPPDPEAATRAMRQKQAQDKYLKLQAQSLDVAKLPNKAPEEKARLISDLLQRDSEPETAQNILIDLVTSRELSEADRSNLSRQLGININTDEVKALYDKLDALQAGAGIEFSSQSNPVGDLAIAAVAPLSFGPAMANIINEVAPHIVTNPTDAVLPGSARQEFINWIKTQPLEKRVEIAQKISDAINRTTYFGIENDITKWEMGQALLKWDENEDVDKYLNNLFGVLDVAAGLGGLRTAAKLPEHAATIKSLGKSAKGFLENGFWGKTTLRESPRSTMGTLNQVAPEKAKNLSDAVLADPTGQVAKSLDTTLETTTVETTLPKMLGDEVVPAPSRSNEGFFTAILSDKEVDSVVENINRFAYSDALRPTAVEMDPSKLHFAVTSDGVEAVFHATRNDEGGWGSLKLAKSVAGLYENSATLAKLQGVTARVLARDFKLGKYVPVEEIDDYARATTRISQKASTVSTKVRNARSQEIGEVKGQIKGESVETELVYSHPSTEGTDIIKDAYDKFIRFNLAKGYDVNTGKSVSKVEYDMLKELQAAGYGIEFSKGVVHAKGRVTSSTSQPVARVLSTRGKPGQFNEGFRSSMGDFIVELRVNEKFTPAHALAENPVRSDGWTGKFAKWFDKGSWGHRWFVSGTNQASDQFSRRLKELRQELSPLVKLSPNEQRKVYEALDQGDLEEHWWSLDELKDRWGHDPKFNELVDAYNAAVKHQHMVYEMINDSIYRRLLGDGVQELSIAGQPSLATPLKSGDFMRISSKINKVLDGETGKVKILKGEDLMAIQEGLAKTARFVRPVREGFDEINYVVYNSKKSKVKTNPLPYNVLTNREGYITRIYDAAYIVRKEYKAHVDGGRIETRYKTVGIENSLGSARALQNQIIEEEVAEAIAEAAKAGKEINEVALRAKIAKNNALVRSDELQTTERYYDPFSLDYLSDTGQLYTSPRRPDEIRGMREEVKNTDVGSAENRARRLVLSVAASMEQSQIKAARAGTLDITVDKLIKNWEALYGKLFTKDGKFPHLSDVPESAELKNANPEHAKLHADAVAFADYIKMLGGFDEGTIAREARKFMINVSERILLNNRESVWRNKLANGLVQARNLNVIDTLKSMAFFQLITMRPLRQAILQMNQMSLYMGHGDYGKYMLGEGAKEFTGMWAGLLSKSVGNFDTLKGTYARRMGMTVQEYEDVIDAYIRTGFPASVDSHVWVLGSRTDRVASSLAKGSSKLDDLTYRGHKALRIGEKAIRRMGFDLGEQTQLLSAFLAEKRAWQLANPKKSHLWKEGRNLGDIAGMARNLSGNMNRAGIVAFQRGGLGAIFQFMSHTTKMLQLIAPQNSKTGFAKIVGLNKIANKHVEQSSKHKMLATQFLFYGTGGLGFSEIYEGVASELGIEIPPDVTSIVEEGFAGTAYNMMMRLAEGQDFLDSSGIDIEVSRSLSPLSGSLFWTMNNPITKLYDYFIDSPTSWHAFAGPGVDVISRRLSGLPVLSHIMMDADYLEADDRLEAALVGLAGVMALETDNWQKTRYELAVHRFMSRKGNRLSSATNTEILTKVLLGPSTRSARQLQDLRTRTQGIMNGYLEQPDMELKELHNKAKTDFGHIKKALQLAGEGDAGVEDLLYITQNFAERNYIFMSPRERDIYKNAIWKQVRNWVSEDTQENQVIKHLMRLFPVMPDDPIEDMFTRLSNSSEFDGKQEFISALETALF